MIKKRQKDDQNGENFIIASPFNRRWRIKKFEDWRQKEDERRIKMEKSTPFSIILKLNPMIIVQLERQNIGERLNVA